MRINPQIRGLFKDISTKSVEHANNPSPDYKYLRRLLKVYDTQLSEEERIYLLKMAMELIHYRNVMVDPDNLLVLSNIRLRTYMFIFVLAVLAMVIGATLFKTNSTLNGLIDMLSRMTKLFSL